MYKQNWFQKVAFKIKLHFDYNKSKFIANKIVRSENVKSHKFFPFLYFELRFFQYKKLKKIKENGIVDYKKEDLFKTRPINYSCYSDSFIFAYYNELLAKYYEEILKQYDLKNNIIAYRSIKNFQNIGKCNIHFAAEAFVEIKKRKNCFCIGLDIKEFFQNLDHKILKSKLKETLNQRNLSEDWYQVYKILTDFHYIDINDFFKKLGNKKRKDFWTEENGFERICSPKQFRQIIIENPEIIQKNPKKNLLMGIPQGTNISGLFANIYMLDFDKELKKYLDNINGYYRRYSDDILIIVDNKEQAENTLIFLKNYLNNKLRLELSEDKTLACSFAKGICKTEAVSIRHIPAKENLLQYLGFTYDGENIRLRNSTLGNFWKEAKPHIKNMVRSGIKNNNKIPLRKIYGLYSHLVNKKQNNKYGGNFYDYVRKAEKIMTNEYGLIKECKIKHQTRNFWPILQNYLQSIINEKEENLTN
ncbi:MAG: reverse transcriptase/maturase family protein [Candidatus Gastranaerophilaceae bacterium]